jgi:hypothetical protein
VSIPLLISSSAMILIRSILRSYQFSILLIQPTISLEMPVPNQGHYVFTIFRLLTDFVCLYNYEFWLSLCKIFRSSVILLLTLLTLTVENWWRSTTLCLNWYVLFVMPSFWNERKYLYFNKINHSQTIHFLVMFGIKIITNNITCSTDV